MLSQSRTSWRGAISSWRAASLAVLDVRRRLAAAAGAFSGRPRSAGGGGDAVEAAERERSRALQPVPRRVVGGLADAVEAVGVAAGRRAVDVAPVGEQAVEDHHR